MRKIAAVLAAGVALAACGSDDDPKLNGSIPGGPSAGERRAIADKLPQRAPDDEDGTPVWRVEGTSADAYALCDRIQRAFDHVEGRVWVKVYASRGEPVQCVLRGFYLVAGG